MIEKYGDKIKAIANITGEGVHNVRRVLSNNLGLYLNYSDSAVQKPHPIFTWIQEHADIPTKEMYEDYNMGTGMIIIVDRKEEESVIKCLNEYGKNQKYD